MFSTFDRVYNFSINTIVFIITIVITALFWFGATLIFENVALYIPITILGSVVGILIGSYLYVILSIPFQLSKKFDVIKNKVALQEYKDVNDFQNDIAAFLMEAFQYPGVSLDGGVFEFNKAEKLTVNVDFELELFDDLNEQKTTKKINGFTAYYIPVIIGNKNLGSMILFSKGFTLPILRSILIDFENYMLDDQLLIMQNR